MSNMIPFESAKLPAHLRTSKFQPVRDMVTGEAYPMISIKGKVFTKVNGDEREIIMVGDSDEPARSLEVVVVNYNKGVSKVYYESTYTEGSDAKPTCYSNNGNKPEPDAESPQAKTCAACPHNAWGSRITENGGKGKACSDSRRLAVSPAGQINDPMMLRIPATSLKTLAQYQDLLFKRGVAIQQVVTKIGFDYNVAYPSLTFKPIGFLSEEQLTEVEEVFESPVVMKILGTHQEAPVVVEAEKDVAPAAAAPAAPKKKAKVVVEEDEEEAPAPVQAKAKEKKAEKPEKKAPVVEVSDDLEASLDDLLGDDDDFDA